MTIIRARPFVTLPSNGLAMVLQQNHSLITDTFRAHLSYKRVYVSRWAAENNVT